MDTNVISASASAKAHLTPGLVAWMNTQSGRLFLSAVTIAEIEDGIAKARREKAARKADQLAEWLETVIHLYSDRILGFDLDIARTAGGLSDKARSCGHTPGFADMIIGATAHFHQMTILTRNLRHFEPLGIQAFDPFACLPPPAI